MKRNIIPKHCYRNTVSPERPRPETGKTIIDEAVNVSGPLSSALLLPFHTIAADAGPERSAVWATGATERGREHARGKRIWLALLIAFARVTVSCHTARPFVAPPPKPFGFWWVCPVDPSLAFATLFLYFLTRTHSFSHALFLARTLVFPRDPG